MGRVREAVTFLERSIAGYEQAQIPIGIAETELELALALKDLKNPDSRTHLDRACEIFEKHNLPRRVEEAHELFDSN